MKKAIHITFNISEDSEKIEVLDHEVVDCLKYKAYSSEG